MTRNVKHNTVPDPTESTESTGSQLSRKLYNSGSERPTRTILFRILVIGFVLLSWFGWVRLYAVLAHQSVLSRYLSSGLLTYVAAGGAVWGLAGLASAIWLWWGLRYALPVSRWTALGCFVWYWLDDLFLTQSVLSTINWPFMVIATLLALTFAWWVPALPKERLFLSHRRLRKP